MSGKPIGNVTLVECVNLTYGPNYDKKDPPTKERRLVFFEPLTENLHNRLLIDTVITVFGRVSRVTWIDRRGTSHTREEIVVARLHVDHAPRTPREHISNDLEHSGPSL